MREIKFRAWAKKQINNKHDYAWKKTEKKFNPIEPLGNSQTAFDVWYSKKDKYYEKMATEWDNTYTAEEKYTYETKMITNIKVNGEVQRPYGYEILDIMQYTGLKDKNGVEIYESDIVQFRNGDISTVEFKNGGFEPFVIKNWECEGEPKWCEIIGNVHEEVK